MRCLKCPRREQVGGDNRARAILRTTVGITSAIEFDGWNFGPRTENVIPVPSSSLAQAQRRFLEHIGKFLI